MVSRITTEAALTSQARRPERDTLQQRTTKRYDDDCHGKYVGSRLLPLADLSMAARALPPQTNRQTRRKTMTSKDNDNVRTGTGGKCSQLCVV